MRIASSAVLLALTGCGGSGPEPGPDADTEPGTPISYTVFAYGGWQGEPEDIVLVRDGAGPWVRLDDLGDGVFHGRVVGPRYAIARACRTADISYGEVWVYHLTTDDTTDLVDTGCRSATGTVTISGTVTGLDPSMRAIVESADGSDIVFDGVPAYSVPSRHGRIDLVARVSGTGTDRRTQRLLIERDLDITGDLDHPFDLADGVVPDEHRIVVTGTGGGDVEHVSVALATENGSYVIESTPGATDTYRAPPASALRGGDLITVDRSTTVGSSSRGVAIVSASATDLAAALPPAYPAPAPTLVVTPTSVGLAGTLPAVESADYYTVWGFQSDPITSQYTYWSQTYSARWAAGAAVDYEFPDMATVDGWTVGLRPDLEVTWALEAAASTTRDPVSPFANAPGQTVVAGDTTTRAQQSGTLPP